MVRVKVKARVRVCELELSRKTEEGKCAFSCPSFVTATAFDHYENSCQPDVGGGPLRGRVERTRTLPTTVTP